MSSGYLQQNTVCPKSYRTFEYHKLIIYQYIPEKRKCAEKKRKKNDIQINNLYGFRTHNNVFNNKTNKNRMKIHLLVNSIC